MTTAGGVVVGDPVHLAVGGVDRDVVDVVKSAARPPRRNEPVFAIRCGVTQSFIGCIERYCRRHDQAASNYEKMRFPV